MNEHKIFSFETKDGNIFLVLDAIVPDEIKNHVHLQGFVSDSGYYPFSLFFPENFPKENILNEALEGGANYVKDIEQWESEKNEISLNELLYYPIFLQFIRDNCKSDKLLQDIKSLLNENNMV